MTLTINLGVIDQPYLNDAGEKKATTTSEVAQLLEDKYHVMETFFYVNEDNITKYLENSLDTALNAMISGATVKPFIAAEGQIERDFKQFLSNQVMDQLGIPGVPTKAALDGVSHRFKWSINNVTTWELVRGKRVKVKKYGAPRPSFIDTGMYQAAFKAWFEES